MNLILLGVPGSGKGTQAKLISKKYNIPHISTGDIFRTKSHKKVIAKYVTKGILVPDKIVLEIIEERISRPDCRSGFILDGFPRNINQAQSLDKYLNSKNKIINKVLYFKLPIQSAIKRLTARRICPICSKNYNLISEPPQKENICDSCNVSLTQRTDDTIKTVKKRLTVYTQNTKPLILYYKNQNKLRELNADKPVNNVFQSI